MCKIPLDYLCHILDECSYIVSVIDENITKDKLLDDETMKRAVVRLNIDYYRLLCLAYSKQNHLNYLLPLSCCISSKGGAYIFHRQTVG